MSFGPGELLLVLFYLAVPILILYEIVSFHRKTTKQLSEIEELLKSINQKINTSQ